MSVDPAVHPYQDYPVEAINHPYSDTQSHGACPQEALRSEEVVDPAYLNHPFGIADYLSEPVLNDTDYSKDPLAKAFELAS